MQFEEFHERIWKILDPVDENAFEPIAAESASDEAVQGVAGLVGAQLPEWLVRFCQRTNGLLIVAKEEVWPSGKEFDIAPAWTFWRGLLLLGIEHETLPEWATISRAWEWLLDWGVTDVLPLLKVDGDADRLWGLRIRAGEVLDEVVEVIDGEVRVLEGTFLDLYEAQVAELVERQKDMAELLGIQDGSGPEPRRAAEIENR